MKKSVISLIILMLFAVNVAHSQKEEFIKIPIRKKEAILYFTDEESENEKEYNKKLKSHIFDISKHFSHSRPVSE